MLYLVNCDAVLMHELVALRVRNIYTLPLLVVTNDSGYWDASGVSGDDFLIFFQNVLIRFYEVSAPPVGENSSLRLADWMALAMSIRETV